MDYGRPVEFGLSVVPSAAELDTIRAAVTTADRTGLDLVGIQDHDQRHARKVVPAQNQTY